VRAPLIDVRLAGRAISVLLIGLSGRAKLVALARLLGLLSLLPTGPNESLLMPDVDSLATCFVDGVSSPVTDDPLAVLPFVLFLLLMVTLGGI